MMKKSITVLALTIALLLCCAACSQQPAATEPPLTHTAEVSSPSGTEELLSILIEDYDEYLDFIASNPFPDDFIDYESLSAIGEFKHFVCHHPMYGMNEQYFYELMDANGYELFLTIEHRPFGMRTNVAEQLLPTAQMTDLWSHPSGASGYVLAGDLTLQYYLGDIVYIRWGSDDFHIAMCVDSPTDAETTGSETDTLLNQLLSLDTTQDAAQILQQIANGDHVTE